MNTGKREDFQIAKVKRIGIIAEDSSDFEAIKSLIIRTTNIKGVGFKKHLGRGSGRVMSKCCTWSHDLKNRGCNMLIVVHDLDKKNLKELKKQLTLKLDSSPIENRYICIPVEEIEAWFLSDPAGIKKTFSLNRLPKINGQPEKINSPKEYLRNQIYLCSNKERIYLERKNEELAANMSLSLAQTKCPSFAKFSNFLTSQSYS